MLVASVFDEENGVEGYHWVHIQLKGTRDSFASRIEIEQGIKHLKRKYFGSAKKLLKGFKRN